MFRSRKNKLSEGYGVFIFFGIDIVIVKSRYVTDEKMNLKVRTTNLRKICLVFEKASVSYRHSNWAKMSMILFLRVPS